MSNLNKMFELHGGNTLAAVDTNQSSLVWTRMHIYVAQ